MPSIARVIPLAVFAVLTIESWHPLVAQEPQPETKSTFKRRDESTDEELRKQLQLVPEVGFDQATVALLINSLGTGKGGKVGKTPGGAVLPDVGYRFYAQVNAKRPDLLALPWQIGVDSQLGKESAEKLHVFSVNLRAAMQKSVPANDVRPDAAKLKATLSGGKPVGGKVVGGTKPRPKASVNDDAGLAWDKTECVPAIAQMMQTESTALRLLMIGMLSKVQGKESGVVLAQRAVFDVSPDVREKAVTALGKRPQKEYLQVLLDGLRWPWHPAADHAAEALAALKSKDAVPALVAALKEPDPKLPFSKEEGKDKGTYVREVVRMNHMSNCLLCHAPSQSKEDLVRGRIPVPGQEMPPLYYAETSGQFVRAEITYLRQDFSLVQPVNTPGKWPGQQRYDYMLRTRKATAKEITFLQGLRKEGKLLDAYPQRESMLFALREITGKDLGSRPEAWTEFYNPIQETK